MSKRVGNDVEILVHIAAPSAGKDDSLYRALAAAYVDFEVINTVKLEGEVGDGLLSASDEEAEIQLLAEMMQATPEGLWSCDEVDQIKNDDDPYKPSQSKPQSIPERRYLTRSAVKGTTTISPQVSFNSVLDNADSPPLLRHLQAALKTPPPTSRNPPISPVLAQETSWNTLPSVVEDSQQSYNRGRPEFSSPTAVLEQYLQQFETPETPLIPMVEVRGSDPEEEPVSEFARPTPSQLETSFIVQTPDPTPEIIDTSIVLFSSPAEQSRQKFLSETRKQKPAITPKGASKSKKRSASMPTRFSKRQPAQPSLRSILDRDASPSPPRKRRVVSDQTQNSQLVSKPPSIHVSGSGSQHHNHVLNDQLPQISSLCRPNFSSTKQKQREFSSSISPKVASSQDPGSSPPIECTPDEIHPPLPPTPQNKDRNHQLPAVITPSLNDLFVKLHSSYKPQTQIRPLRALERGYWSVSMKDWEPKLRTIAWDKLERFIRGGEAGWGAWCMRCEGGDGDRVGREKDDKKRLARKMSRTLEEIRERGEKEGRKTSQNIQQNLTHLRLYCWAEITAHIWLLLYLVSQKRIKTSEAKWIDGSGKAVIFMN